MRSFKNFVSEKVQPAYGIEPAAGDEKKFKDKHVVDVKDDPHNTKDEKDGIKNSPSKKKRLADREDGKDAEVYESKHDDDDDDEEDQLDPVNKKALKKKFKDRKDKDIDNDGDVDDSDEYLHKRRKAVSKAIGEDVERRADAKMIKVKDPETGKISYRRERSKINIGKGVNESTAAYGKSMSTIADKEKNKRISSSDKDKLGKLAALLKKERGMKEHTGNKPHKHPHGETLTNPNTKDFKVTDADVKKITSKSPAVKKYVAKKLAQRKASMPGSTRDKDLARRKAAKRGVKEGSNEWGSFPTIGKKQDNKTKYDSVEKAREARRKRLLGLGKVNEGYEDAVMKVLKKKRIDGRFDSGNLYVDKKSVSAAKSALKGDFSIKELPKIIGEEQIDEISKAKVGSYIKKANVSTADAAYNADARGTKQIGKIMKRFSGVNRAVDKLTGKAKVPAKEEVEQVDEISKATKSSYLDKAGKDHYNMFTGKKPGSKEKLDKRRAAIQKVSKELTGKKKFSDYDPKTKKYTNEEVELDEKFMIGYGKPGGKITYKYADNLAAVQKIAQQVRAKGFKVGKMGRVQSTKDLPTTMKEGIELNEAGALDLSLRRAGPMKNIFGKSKSDKDLAKEIEAYAKKHGGIDKASFMKVAQMLSKGQRLNAIKFAKKMDTDPRDWVLDKLGEEMSDAQMKKREDIVKGMKKNLKGFKDRYGDRYKDVMYATATKQAMQGEGAFSRMATQQQEKERLGGKKVKGDGLKTYKKKVDEAIAIDEAYKAGNIKLKDGKTVKMTAENAKILNTLYKKLNASNKKQMEQRMMRDQKSFKEIIAFAKEAQI